MTGPFLFAKKFICFGATGVFLFSFAKWVRCLSQCWPCLVADAGLCCVEDQRLFLCLRIAFTSIPDQRWPVSCSYPSSLDIMLACVMHSSWCSVPLVSVFPWYLFATYTVLLKVNEQLRPPCPNPWWGNARVVSHICNIYDWRIWNHSMKSQHSTVDAHVFMHSIVLVFFLNDHAPTAMLVSFFSLSNCWLVVRIVMHSERMKFDLNINTNY